MRAERKGSCFFFTLLMACTLCITSFDFVRADPQDEQPQQSTPSHSKPNILWIYCEDLSPWLPVYGDNIIKGKTPALDQLSRRGVTFTRCYATAPVCSASRSAIITGVHQTTTGTHNHRSARTEQSAIYLPEPIKTLPQLFRKNGYATFNRGKDDYNFTYIRKDHYSHGNKNSKPNKFYGMKGQGHWRELPKGKPWFGQIQLNGGKLQTTKLHGKVNPDTIPLPPYFPDEKLFRDNWAKHYDCIRITDSQVASIIKQLSDDGLLDNTVIFFFSDHGNNLSLRHKQFCYEGGLHVPLIISGPGIPTERIRPGLVSTLDISATTLALANIELPNYLDGQDLFAENYQQPSYIISARDRCDFTIDRIRSVRTEKMRYIRNFKTDRILLQPQYRDKHPQTLRLRELHAKKQLAETPATTFFGKRPAEELYLLHSDPHQVHNLATNPRYAEELQIHRDILDYWIQATDDKGQYPESAEHLEVIYQRWGSKCVNPEFDTFKKTQKEQTTNQ